MWNCHIGLHQGARLLAKTVMRPVVGITVFRVATRRDQGERGNQKSFCTQYAEDFRRCTSIEIASSNTYRPQTSYSQQVPSWVVRYSLRNILPPWQLPCVQPAQPSCRFIPSKERVPLYILEQCFLSSSSSYSGEFKLVVMYPSIK